MTRNAAFETFSARSCTARRAAAAHKDFLVVPGELVAGRRRRAAEIVALSGRSRRPCVVVGRPNITIAPRIRKDFAPRLG